MNIEQVIAFIQAERTDGVADTKIRAKLVLNDVPAKLIAEAFKACKPEKAVKQGFAAQFYDWLSAGKRSDAAIKAYIMGEGEYGETSKNTKNHLSHYTNIAKLANSIWDQVGGETMDEQEPKQDDNADAIKQAWRELKAEMNRARPRKHKVHPDRVSHLGDEELTAAYTQAFQDLNGTSRKAA